MLVKKKLNKEKSILLGIFIVLFCASFVLIMFERNKINKELAELAKNEQSKISQIILGDQVSRTSVAEYNDIVKISFARILSNISRFRATGKLIRAESTQAYNDLLEAKVPTIYQDFHLNLVSLAKYLSQEENPSLLHVISGRDSLFKEFPWLSDLLK